MATGGGEDGAATRTALAVTVEGKGMEKNVAINAMGTRFGGRVRRMNSLIVRRHRRWLLLGLSRWHM
ncbi:predicted protein [Arabidopsis lyrata subsp. lyrata]|uniref:Predicted protein n=1 Tax=Arabidopsis lyrata subsp. lyrata TaxID=81972 RepID=D7LPZ4_ARALL|nr:predicted protein [Arabidopsis lyrata subsp. lyrata]